MNFKIGKMVVTIEGNTITTNHPENAMKTNGAKFKMSVSLRTGLPMVVITGRGFEKYQSVAAQNKIKAMILKGAK